MPRDDKVLCCLILTWTPIQCPIELGILRSFEFVSQLRRASVVVRQFGDGGASVFVKGAPESVKDICRPESCELHFQIFSMRFLDF